MEAEEIISLLDSYWYSQQIFKKNTCIINPSSSSSPPHNFQENPSKPKIFNQSSNHKRSSSDQMKNSNSMASSLVPPIDSPNSVLQEEQKDDSFPRKEGSRTRPTYYHLKKKRSLSKSLSELEFEEVKGFMDLGFVFSEEDKETSLVEIIPGLQRIIGNSNNKEECGGESVNNEKCLISRPYLSEAWDDLNKRKRREKENPLMNWRIPNVSDEINMKDNLKWWAQAVASTVNDSL